jgi:hypothetical protein
MSRFPGVYAQTGSAGFPAAAHFLPSSRLRPDSIPHSSAAPGKPTAEFSIRNIRQAARRWQSLIDDRRDSIDGTEPQTWPAAARAR